MFWAVAVLLTGLSSGLSGCSSAPKWSAPIVLHASHLIVKTDENHKLGHEVLRESQAFRTELNEWLGKNDTERLTVCMFRDYLNFKDVMSAKGEGITYFGYGEPVVGLPRWPLKLKPHHCSCYVSEVLSSVGADWRFRLRHELVHVAFRNAHGLDRDWLWEGLADYFAHGGLRGDGIKAQRFLTLRQAANQGQLHSFNQLRKMHVNAGVSNADLRYSESWSFVYSLLNHHGPELRQRVFQWLKRGAPGKIDSVFKEAGVSISDIDQVRRNFIENYACYLALEKPPIKETEENLWSHAPDDFQSGDVLLKIWERELGPIESDDQLANSLAYLHFIKNQARPDLAILCEYSRRGDLARKALRQSEFKNWNWQLTVRPIPTYSTLAWKQRQRRPLLNSAAVGRDHLVFDSDDE